MSHVFQIESKLHDPLAICAACRRLALKEPVEGTARLFSESVTGLLVELPGWRYPVVIDTAGGTVRCDNYGGHWGEQWHLEQLTQIYAVEKAKIEARRRGHAASERTLEDGSILVSIEVVH